MLLLGFVFIRPTAKLDAGGPSAVPKLFSTATYVFYGRNSYLRYPTWGSYAPTGDRGTPRSAHNVPLWGPIQLFFKVELKKILFMEGGS